MGHWRHLNKTLIVLYLGAIVAANLLVAKFGQIALPLTAFVLIPFDLTSRDVLHERWEGNRLWIRMGLLILTGSILSFAINQDSWRVALASCVSFLLAGSSDCLLYAFLKRRGRFVRMNGSNLVSSIVDSIAFPFIAFGSTIWMLSASQAGSKFIGGLLWSALFVWLLKKGSHVYSKKNI